MSPAVGTLRVADIAMVVLQLIQFLKIFSPSLLRDKYCTPKTF